MLRISAELEKGNKDRLLPIAPEFARFRRRVPEHKRMGYVFEGLAQRQRSDRINLSAVGKDAGVGAQPKHSDKATKFGSAHDLRRSFGKRWASRVMPQVQMDLVRHENVETTLRYYVGRNAQTTESVL
jgi:integrase